MHFSFNPLLLVSSAVMGSIAAYVGYKRGRNPYLCFIVGFLFGVFGVFAVFFTSPKKKLIPHPGPSFIILGPSDKFWYYLDPEQKQQGPMSRNAVVSAWQEGRIDLSTYVWHEEMIDWKPLRESLKIE